MREYCELTDDQLVSLYTEGKNEAFDALLARHDAAVHTYIRFTISDAYLADDIFQDTFIKVITTIRQGRYSSEGKFKAWVLRIAHNLMMDHFRRERTEAKWRAPSEESEVNNPLFRLVGDDLNGEEKMMTQDELNELYINLTHLPMEQRQVVMLRYWEEMSFKEIALTTGVSINTALGRMRYALMNLRRLALQ